MAGTSTLDEESLGQTLWYPQKPSIRVGNRRPTGFTAGRNGHDRSPTQPEERPLPERLLPNACD
jgi:hypothetical protein